MKRKQVNTAIKLLHRKFNPNQLSLHVYKVGENEFDLQIEFPKHMHICLSVWPDFGEFINSYNIDFEDIINEI